jgi:sugar/nucleoside kinase (ribokinase family)
VQASKWVGGDVLLPAYPLEAGSEANSNGAGDAFVSGLLAAVLSTRELSLEQAVRVALLAALQRVDSAKRARREKLGIVEIFDMVA